MTDHRDESSRAPERDGTEKLPFTKETLKDLDAKAWDTDADAVQGGAPRGCPLGSGCFEGCSFTAPG